MMINWLLYTALSSMLLLLAGYCATYAARSLRLPTRHVWAVVLLFSVVLSGLSLWSRTHDARAQRTAANAAPEASGTPGVASLSSPRTTPPSDEAQLNPSPVATALALPFGVDELTTQRFDGPLRLACAGAALLALGMLGFSMTRLRRKTAAFERARALDTPVLVSPDIGPALTGVFRYTVVLPRWSLELPPSELRTILAHEQQHAQARDPALLLFGLLMVALQPWNIVLWAAWSRLRLAIEVDCDARVLAMHGDPRAYGHLLVRVHERSMRRMLPLSSLVSRQSDLETRIRRMMQGPRPASALRAVSALVSALIAGTAAASCDVAPQASRSIQDASARIATADPSHPDSILQFFVDGERAKPERVARLALEDMATIEPVVENGRVKFHIGTMIAATLDSGGVTPRIIGDSTEVFVMGFRLKFYARRHMPTVRLPGEGEFLQRLSP